MRTRMKFMIQMIIVRGSSVYRWVSFVSNESFLGQIAKVDRIIFNQTDRNLNLYKNGCGNIGRRVNIVT
jgi:hypothetical protein